MPSEQDILGLLTGTLSAEQRARVADELARDPAAGRRAFGAERLAAVAVLLGHTRSSVRQPAGPPAVSAPPQLADAIVATDDVLRDALRSAGKDAWAYHPARDASAPAVATVVRGALQEWSGTWHARLLLLAGAIALFYAALALLKSNPALMRPSAGGQYPTVVSTNTPPVAPAPVPSP